MHKVVHEADLKVYNEILPLKKREIQEIVTSLSTGECIFVHDEIIKKIRVRLRETFHAGYTPTLTPVETPELRTIRDEIIKLVKEVREDRKRKKSKIRQLQEEILRLKSIIAEKDKKINELEEVLRTLGYIKFPERLNTLRVDKLVIESPITHQQQQQRTIQATARALHEKIETTPNTKSHDNELPQPVKRHLKRILKLLKSLPPLEKKILAFLADRYPNEYGVDRLAAWTGYSEKTIRNNPPLKLVELGLIERWRKSDGYHYRASLPAFVRREFEKFLPDLGEDQLKSVEDILKERIVGEVG